MMLLPFGPPRVGLAIDARTLAYARVGSRILRRAASVQAVKSQTMPPGAIAISHQEANIVEQEPVADSIRQVTGRRRGALPLPISLTLADGCSRMAVFTFDTFPDRPEEAKALLQWRFQQDGHPVASTARLAYRHCLRPIDDTGAPARHHVLAATTPQSVIDQYERACEAGGCVPVRVGLAGFRLFDLFRRSTARAVTASAEWFFLHVSYDGFTLTAFRDRVPVFVRSRTWKSEAQEHSWPAMLVHELRATVQYYDDAVSPPLGPLTACAGRPLCLIDTRQADASDDHLSMGDGSRLGSRLLAPITHEVEAFLHVQLIPLVPSLLRDRWRGVEAPLDAVTALAGLGGSC